jgi:tetratricopeptide (TPR) repeat protein
MKLITTTALAIALALPIAPAVGQTKPATAQAAAPQVKPSAKALKAIVDLQDAVNKKDWASVPAKVAAAQAVASTKEDRYLIGSLQLRAAAGANDTAAFASALEAVGQTGLVDTATMASMYNSLGGTYLKNKQFPQAAAAYQRSAALNPSNADTLTFLGEAQLGAGQKAEAAASFQRAIEAERAAGKKPDEDLMKEAVATSYEAKSPAAVDLARQWVAAYPSPNSWSNAIAIYSNLNQTDAEAKIDLFRLMQATGALNSATLYEQYAAVAADMNNTNEARAVLDAGLAAKVLSPSDAQYREIAAGVKAKPMATAADLQVATKSAVNGTALLRIGDRYYGMGDYTKAVELYRMAMGKPGVDPAVANLHIGTALARAGDKAGATTALNAVTGPRAEIAKYWLLYVSQKA